MKNQLSSIYSQINLAFLLFLSNFNISLAQELFLENGTMEDWILHESGTYEEPAPAAYWATSNPVSLLGPTAPVTVFKETELVIEGNYAAKMVTDSFAIFMPPALPVAGALALGDFEPDFENFGNSLKLGKPFTDTPTHFRGHYMYFPQNNDSCAIYARLTKWNTALNKQDTIAEAFLTTGETVDSYTYYDIPFDYISTETPDTLIVVFTSSARGIEFIAQPGSTLYIDGTSILSGVDIPLMPEITVRTYPNPVTERLFVELAQPAQNASIHIYHLDGKKLNTYPLSQQNNVVQLNHLPNGLYFYQVYVNEVLAKGGKLKVEK